MTTTPSTEPAEQPTIQEYSDLKEELDRLRQWRKDALDEANHWYVGWDLERNPSPDYVLVGNAWRDASRRIRIALRSTENPDD